MKSKIRLSLNLALLLSAFLIRAQDNVRNNLPAESPEVIVAGCNCTGTHSGGPVDYSTGWTHINSGNSAASAAVPPTCDANKGNFSNAGISVNFNTVRDDGRVSILKAIQGGTLPATWTTDFTFSFTPAARPTYFPGHDVFIFSQNTAGLDNSSNSNCQPANPSPTNNDAIWVTLNSISNPGCGQTPPNGSFNNYGSYSFSAHSRKGAGPQTNSALIPLNGGTVYYLRLHRYSATLGFLSVFTDPSHTQLLGAVCFDIDPTITTLDYQQHANGQLGDCERTLNAQISNVFIDNGVVCPPNLLASFSLNSQYCLGDHILVVPDYVASSGGHWVVEECDQSGTATLPHYAATYNFTHSPPTLNLTYFTLLHGFSMHPIHCNQYYSVTLVVNVCNQPVQAIKKVFFVRCLPNANAGPDKSICLGNSVQIGTGSSGNTLHSWLPNNGTLSNVNISNPIASPTVSTSYTLTVTELIRNGCSNTDVVNVFVHPLPIVDAGPDKLICGTSGMVSIGSGTNSIFNAYTWAAGAGGSVAPNPPFCNGNVIHCHNPNGLVTSTTTFTLSAVGPGPLHCLNSDEVTIYVANPVADAGPDQTVCIIPNLNTAVPLGGSNTSTGAGFSYSWAPSAGLACGSCANAVASPTVTTTYTLTVTYTAPNGQSCVTTDQVTIYVGDTQANAGPDQTICLSAPQSVPLGAPSAGTGYTYSWVPASTLSNATSSHPFAFPSVTTTYTLTVNYTSPMGISCPSHNDQVTVYVGNPIADAGPDAAICLKPLFVVGAQLGGPNTSTGAGITYSWQPTGSLSSSSTISNPLATPTVTTTYTLTVTYTSPTGQTCVVTDQVTVFVGDPIANAGPDQVVCPYNILNAPPASVSIGTNASPSTNVLWTPGTNLSSTTTVPTTASPTSNTSYTLTVTDPASGCISSDVVNVIVACPGPLADAGQDIAMCCNTGFNTISLPGNASGGLPPYTYSWSPSTGIVGGSAQAPKIDLCKVMGPGNNLDYTLTVTDALGNASTDVVNVLLYANPVADAGPDQTVCCSALNLNMNLGGTPLGIGASASGGQTPYSYSWTTTASIGPPNVTFTGNTGPHPLYHNSTVCKDASFTLTVIDANGCTATSTVNVLIDLSCREKAPLPVLYEIKIMPNPTKNIFTIQSSQTLSYAVVEVTDLLGRSVYKKQYSKLGTEQVSLAEFPAGIYNVNVSSNELNQTYKVVKE